MARVSVSPVAEYGEIRLARFYALLAKGLFRVEACRAAQIDPGRVDRWLRAGEQGAEAFVEFTRRVREAEAELVEHELDMIRKADDYRARVWFLERRFPRQWGPRGDGDAEVTAGQVDELREKLRDRLEAIIGQRDTAAGDS